MILNKYVILRKDKTISRFFSNAIYIKIVAKIAIIISGILFGLVHFGQSSKQALFAGINGCLVLDPLMEKYGLLTSIAAHITSNILTVGTLFQRTIIVPAH